MMLYTISFFLVLFSISAQAKLTKACEIELDNFCYKKLPKKKLADCHFENREWLTKKCQELVSNDLGKSESSTSMILPTKELKKK